MSDLLFGWDLIYKLSEASIKKKEDAITLLIHFLLLKSGFKCIGIGESKDITGSEASSEALPDGWSDASSYSLRYVANGTLHILRGVPVNNSIVYNLLQPDSLQVTNVALVPDDVVSQTNGSVEVMFSSSKDLIDRIRTQLIAPLKERNASEVETQTRAQDTSKVVDPDPRPALCIPRPDIGIDPMWQNAGNDPFNFGGSDLDPFSRGGGGMIFNPFDPRRNLRDRQPPGLPRGSVPPGARFDPFSPPGVGPGRGPQGPRRDDGFGYLPPAFPGPDPDNMYM